MHTITVVFLVIIGMIGLWNLFWFGYDWISRGGNELGVFFFVLPSWIVGILTVVVYALISVVYIMAGHP